MPHSHRPHCIARSQHSSPSCRKTYIYIYIYISLVCSALEYSAVVWNTYQKNDRQATKHPEMDVSPTFWETLDCSRFRIERNSNDWRSSSTETVRGLTPALPANEFLTPISSGRPIKPWIGWNPTDFKTTNIVINHARNNSQSYTVDPRKTAIDRYSFFPGSRPTIDWNNLEREIVLL